MTDAMSPSDELTISLTADEALVLFELLSRWNDNADGAKVPGAAYFESPAETAILDALCCLLEQQLTAPFSEQYKAMLTAARDRLKPC